MSSHVNIERVVAAQRQARINRQAIDRARIARMMHEAPVSAPVIDPVPDPVSVMDAVIERALVTGNA